MSKFKQHALKSNPNKFYNESPKQNKRIYDERIKPNKFTTKESNQINLQWKPQTKQRKESEFSLKELIRT